MWSSIDQENGCQPAGLAREHWLTLSPDSLIQPRGNRFIPTLPAGTRGSYSVTPSHQIIMMMMLKFIEHLLSVSPCSEYSNEFNPHNSPMKRV